MSEVFPVKVNGFQPLPGTNQTESNRSAKTGAPSTESSQSASSADVVTHFSQLPQDQSQDIDTAKVDSIRQAIRDGQLTMRADQIAESLLQSLTESSSNTD
ncbi:flagellar biosynthesis anti-sigma factor FlgM [Pseudidiomarina aestuarii]|uniref:flagellar biosynthesis anti-sigma factor FlgM n=1 Tax=Pseudidiomarina aestuarii TaxID=624146 RepID=UPI003A96A53B